MSVFDADITVLECYLLYTNRKMLYLNELTILAGTSSCLHKPERLCNWDYDSVYSKLQVCCVVFLIIEYCRDKEKGCQCSESLRDFE